MRLSLYRSACTSAVALTLVALPCLAQSAESFTIQMPAQHTQVTCGDVSHLKACIDAQDQLSAKEKAKLNAMMPSLKQELADSLKQYEASAHPCLMLKVYQYPKGYPEAGAGAAAEPTISVCESAAAVREKTLEMQRPPQR